MIHAQYRYSTNETGSESALASVGYFSNLNQAKAALRGLCPWDFNTMRGFSSYIDFVFTDAPGRLDRYKDKSFLQARDKQLVEARKHAAVWKGNGHHTRAPKDWGFV